GASETPVYILIHNDEVSILPADDLWGLDIIETQEVIQDSDGKVARTLTIGPAGECLSRIATVHARFPARWAFARSRLATLAFSRASATCLAS
ncbi:MAG: hypothetical protein GY772_01400, partial [bacterium]|nr:hypothetical protein [bacterium]